MAATSDLILEQTYEEWRKRGSPGSKWADLFWAPLLISKPENWDGAQHRIAIVGQETGDLPHAGLNNLSEFFARADAVASMQETYRHFMADHRQSPFFQYFKKVSEALQATSASTSLVWSNVVRCAANVAGGHQLKDVPEPLRGNYLQWQRGLLRQELHAIKPTAILFFSGPN